MENQNNPDQQPMPGSAHKPPDVSKESPGKPIMEDSDTFMEHRDEDGANEQENYNDQSANTETSNTGQD